MTVPFVLKNFSQTTMPRVKGFSRLQVRQREHLENALAYLENISQDLKLIQLRIRQAKKRTGLHDLLNPADDALVHILEHIKKYRQEIIQGIDLISIETDGHHERKPP